MLNYSTFLTQIPKLVIFLNWLEHLDVPQLDEQESEATSHSKVKKLPNSSYKQAFEEEK